MDDNFRELVKKELTKVNVDLEREILAIIHRGSGAEEVSRRPIRELIQNADDAHSDRIHIHFDKKGLLFQNDGLGLKGEYDSNGELVGTVKSILRIHEGSKEENKLESGNFGSGFRSTHLFSDSAEIHGILNLQGQLGEYVGICSPFTDDVDTESGLERAMIPNVRNDKMRPVRKRALISSSEGLSYKVGLEASSERCGVAFYWPWRKEARNSKWSGMLWDDKRIIHAALDIIEAIPNIILGCRWIRETIVTIDLPGNKGTHAWSRNFNIHEFLEKDIQTDVKITQFHSTKIVNDDALKFDFSNFSIVKNQEFWLFNHIETSLVSNAHKADLLPNCMLIVPLSEEQHELPSYTPIALTISSGNEFSPLAFLPPHESRTKIKIDDSIEWEKKYWAANAMNIFCKNLLPSLFARSIKASMSGEITHSQFLSMIARCRPEKWFGCDPLDFLNGDIKTSWNNYTTLVSNGNLFPEQSGKKYTSASDVVRLKIDCKITRKSIFELVEFLGASVISDEKIGILEELSESDWAGCNPLDLMHEISTPLDLLRFLSQFNESMTLSNIGEKLVKELINVLCINPSGDWDSEDSKRIPIIPDSEGKLWPLRTEEGGSHFYSASENFPDILPNSRTLHPSFIKTCAALQFKPAPAAELAKLVDEASREKPEIFNNLQSHPKMHKQVSMALLTIIKGEQYKLESVCKFNFIPCKVGKQVIVRRPNHIGENIWGVTSGFPVRNWENHTHRDFIFADKPEDRKALKLHKLVEEKLVWLELHKDQYEDLDDIRKALQIHKVTPQVKGIGLIRSLIFAEDGNGMSKVSPQSVFYRNDSGKWELENWLGVKLDKKTIDEVLNSLLNLLSDKSKISGGWGAYPKEKLGNLYLLKDENGDWSKVEDLCLELPKDLSILFKRRTLSEEHKTLLKSDLLATDMPKDANSPGGLGVPRKISEDVIINKINSFDGQDNETRTKIIDMMLNSEEEWSLEQLNTLLWVPRLDGKSTKFEDTTLPTPQLTKLFGDKHPFYIDTETDSSEKGVKSRSDEIGIKSDSKDIKLLHNLLTEPEEVWEDLVGYDILKQLSKAYEADSTQIISSAKINRLPDNNGEWHDNSWLVDAEVYDDVCSLFPGRNIVKPSDIGGEKIANMAKQWILPNPCGPSLEDLITQLVKLSNIGSGNVNKKQLESVWNLINQSDSKHLLKRILDYHNTSLLLVETGGKVVTLQELFVTDEKSQMLVDSESITKLSAMDESETLSELLSDYFGVLNLAEAKPKDLDDSVTHISNEGYTILNIERYWCILASLASRYEALVEQEVWLYKSSVGFEFTRAKPISLRERMALIPDIYDSEEEILRMISSKLSLLWLPKLGHIKDEIYRSLDSVSYRHKLPFIRNECTPRNSENEIDDKTDWPFLTRAMQNVLDALIHTDNNFLDGVDKIKVYKTKQEISSDLYAQTSLGTPEVFWKISSNRESVLININVNEGFAELLISVSGSRLEDHLIEDKIRKRLIKNTQQSKDLLRKIMRANEEDWGGIDSSLDINHKKWKIHERPLVATGIHSEFSEKLSRWYGGCQVCGRQTPSDRAGGFQEGVVSLFKESGGRYKSDSIQYTIGNVMYLCPVHKSLYSRSKHSKLLWIPVIEEAQKQINATPTKEKVEEMVNAILSTSGDIEIEVMTYERIKGDGEEVATDKSHQVVWKKEHASSFRDALTQYLTGLI